MASSNAASGRQPDQLAAGHRHSVAGRLGPDGLEHPVDGRLLVLQDVDGHLHLALVLQRHPHGPHVPVAAAREAHGLGDALGDGQIVGGQIHVERDQREAHAHDRGPRAGVEHRRAGVGRALRGGQRAARPSYSPRRTSGSDSRSGRVAASW